MVIRPFVLIIVIIVVFQRTTLLQYDLEVWSKVTTVLSTLQWFRGEKLEEMLLTFDTIFQIWCLMSTHRTIAAIFIWEVLVQKYRVLLRYETYACRVELYLLILRGAHINSYPYFVFGVFYIHISREVCVQQNCTTRTRRSVFGFWIRCFWFLDPPIFKISRYSIVFFCVERCRYCTRHTFERQRSHKTRHKLNVKEATKNQFSSFSAI